MNRVERLNRLVRKSFRHLNRVQTGTAFVRHYFIVMEHNQELQAMRYSQIVRAREEQRHAKEFSPISF